MPSPTERVVALSSQGLSEPEIIQTLKQEGYTPIQVDSAMREALRGAATGQPSVQRYPPQREGGYAAPLREEYRPPAREYPERGPQPAQPAPIRPYNPYAPPPAAYDDISDEEEGPEYGAPVAGQQPGPAGQGPGEPPLEFEQFKRQNKDLGFPTIPGRDEEELEEEPLRPIPRLETRDRTRNTKQERTRMIEELTEGVVEEKWQDFRGRIDEMNSTFQQLNSRIAMLEQKINAIQGDKKSDLMEIEGKIDGYKQTMDEIESRMESVERAMKDSLTPMMQTLRSLSETIKSLKAKKE
jgi:prefoldin subunit 5